MVQEKWYQGLTNAFIQHSLNFVLMGFSVVILALIVGTIEFYQTEQTSTGTNLMFLGLATISIGVACLSLKIAKESDEKMKTLSEDTFLAVAGVLEDRRLSLMNTRLQLEYLMKTDTNSNTLEYRLARMDYSNILSFSIWKCFTDIKRVELFKDYLKNKEFLEDKQEKILNYLLNYYQELITGRDLLSMKISPEYKNHIKWMFEIAGEFDVYPMYVHNNMLYELMLDLQK